MAYTKTSWVARVGTALNRFLKSNESSGSVELTNDPTGVTTAGTPFTVDNMNKIEQGIYDAHVGLDNNGLIGNTRVNQDVRTTASPTFADVHATVNGAQFYTGGAKKATIFTGTKTKDEWYDLLLPYFPNVGDYICAQGRITESSTNGIILYLKREVDGIRVYSYDVVGNSISNPGLFEGVTTSIYATIIL